MVLQAENVNSYYGAVQALHDVSFDLDENEIVSIIGNNGAGKSTLMKSVMGLVQPKSGSIKFQGKELTKLKSHEIVREGIVYVPEGREVFARLSVSINLKMGAFCRKYTHKQLHDKYAEMFEMFPRLKERRNQLAGSLSGGEQQMLAIARGLMSDPKLILFDEPSLGLAPVIVDELFDVIARINKDKNIPIVMVEQNAYMALSVSKRCYVLENGKVKISGESSRLLHDDEIKIAYLGG